MMCRLQMSPLRANMPRYSTVPAASLFATWQALMAWSSTRRRSIIRICSCTATALSLKAYNFALDIDPSFTLAWNGKGNTLYNMQGQREARIDVQREIV